MYTKCFTKVKQPQITKILLLIKYIAKLKLKHKIILPRTKNVHFINGFGMECPILKAIHLSVHPYNKGVYII